MSEPREFTCTTDTGLGWAFGCSRPGASHTAAGKPSDDAYAIHCGAAGACPCLALAVADGHGDERCDLSRAGAALATTAAVFELLAFFRGHAGAVPENVLRSDFRADVPRRMTRRWRELVLDDAGGRGIAVPENAPEPVIARYGTTLIAALVTETAILAGQVGDGDLVLVRPDGTIEIPVPRDTDLVGSETRSLSSRDAHLLWKTATLDRGQGGVLIAASDGVSDSFDGPEGEEFFTFISSLNSRIRTYGMEAVAHAMAGWLDRYSALASGDDMTIVWAVITPAPSAGPAPIRAGEGW